MAVQTLRLGGREFVILPKREYERLRAKARKLSEQDRGDIAESRRRLAAPGKSIALSDVRHRLGL
jgi:hypothetical protein